MALQSLDIAAARDDHTAPSVRETTEVAKLIDVSTCIGCKACQPPAWNGTTSATKSQLLRVYDNRSTDGKIMDRDALREVEEKGKLEWLIRKDAACTAPTRAASRPARRRAPSSSTPTASWISTGKLHRLRLLHHGCPFNIPRISEATTRLQVHVVFRPGRRRSGSACAKACPTGAIQFGSKEQMKDYAEHHRRPQVARLRPAGSMTRKGGGTHVMYVLHHADRPELYKGLPTPSISPLVSLWKALPSRWRAWPWPPLHSQPVPLRDEGRTRYPRNWKTRWKRRMQNDPQSEDLTRYDAQERQSWLVASASSCSRCPAWASSTRPSIR